MLFKAILSTCPNLNIVYAFVCSLLVFPRKRIVKTANKITAACVTVWAVLFPFKLQGIRILSFWKKNKWYIAFTSVCLFVCVSVCLSVRLWTKCWKNRYTDFDSVLAKRLKLALARIFGPRSPWLNIHNPATENASAKHEVRGSKESQIVSKG